MKNNSAGHSNGVIMCFTGGWGRGGGRPAKPKTSITIHVEQPHPLTAFNLMLLLHRNNLWTPEIAPEHFDLPEMLLAFRSQVTEKMGLSEDSEVWQLVEPLGITQKMADDAAKTQIPGSLFGWGYNVDVFDSFPSEFVPERRLCVDPALALGVMARINGGFYKADRSPDYTLGHILQMGHAFSDPRIPGEDLYPLWVEQPKVVSKKNSKKRSA